MIHVLLRDLAVAYDESKAEAPTRRVSAKPDLWTAPDRSAAHSQAGTGPAP